MQFSVVPLAAAMLFSVAPTHAHTCKIYDGTLYANKPAGGLPGLLPIQIAYEGDLWDWSDRAATLPVRANVERQADIAEAAGVPLVLDIERWQVDASVSDELVAEHVARLDTVVEWARSVAPTIQHGYFSLAPMPAVAWALASEGSPEFLAWRAANERLRDLANRVDLIFPYAYTYTYNPQEWRAATIRNIEEARRYGKPVHLFLWPQYSERSPDLAYQFIPADFWRLQVETACAYADGVVIWGGWDAANNRRATWDETAAWWHEVQAFLNEAEEPEPDES